MKKIARTPRVTAVEVMPPHALRLTFDDGLTRDVDLAGVRSTMARSCGRMVSNWIRSSFMATSSRRRQRTAAR